MWQSVGGRENVCTGAALTVPYSWRLKSINSFHGREFASVQDNEKLWENFDIDKCQADMMVVLPTSIRDGRCPYDSYKLREGLATQPQSMR